MALPSSVTPLNIAAWQNLLDCSPHVDSDWLLDGLHFGFDLGVQGGPPVSAARNCKTALSQPTVIDDYLRVELEHGSIAGPFASPPVSALQINRFGVIPKSTPGKWRLITDLSYPQGAGVNSLISDEFAEVRYEGILEAIAKISNFGQGTLMAKFDLKRAYRLLPVKAEQRFLLGMRWKEMFYVDLALPFGLRSAPKLFTRFADVLEHLLAVRCPMASIQHYLDDFFVACRPNSDDCVQALSTCMAICKQLGVPLADDKTDGPATCLTFLGFVLDSEKLELRVPDDKIIKIKALLDQWVSRKTGTKRELLSLIGRLQHCCQAITLGRPFLRRLIDRAYSVTELHHYVRLSPWEREDIAWWHTLFEKWNGRSLFLLAGEQSSDLSIESDAAGSVGFAAIFKNQWFADRWPVGAETLNIAIKELIPIVLAAFIWGDFWGRQRICFRCDNIAVVECLRNGSCRERHLAFLLRELATLAIVKSFDFTATHVPGVKNKLADALSRFNFQAFSNLAPTADSNSLEIPQNYLLHLVFPPWTKAGNTC